MEIGSFSVFLLLYNICYHFFHNTTVNAQPLCPPIFDKIAPHFNNKQMCFLIWVPCVYGVFLFLLIFGYPFPPPWARLVPFWAECGAIVGRFW